MEFRYWDLELILPPDPKLSTPGITIGKFHAGIIADYVNKQLKYRDSKLATVLFTIRENYCDCPGPYLYEKCQICSLMMRHGLIESRPEEIEIEKQHDIRRKERFEKKIAKKREEMKKDQAGD